MGAVITTFPVTNSLAAYGYRATLLHFGIAMGAIAFVAAPGMRRPPKEWRARYISSTGAAAAARLHDATGSWIPVFIVVISLDLITAVLAITVLKPLRERYRHAIVRLADTAGAV